MTPFECERRKFLKGTVSVAGALLLGGSLSTAREARRSSNTIANPLTVWISIRPDNSVTLIASQSEMGQGTTTTLAAALADELYLPIENVTIEFAPFAPPYRDPIYNWMFTGNSQGISSFYQLMHRMGAAAREMLMTAASQRMNVSVRELTMKGRRIWAAAGQSVSFGEIAAAAAKLPVPTKPTLRQGGGSAGHAVKRWDIPAKVDGSAIFGIDVKIPGLVRAAVRHAPRFGGQPARYDKQAIEAKPGIVAVVGLPTGLAVVAETYWQAHRALEAATITWEGGAEFTSGSELAPVYQERLLSGAFFTHKATGDAGKVIDEASQKIEAVYRLPFEAHATMEPMNCTARIAGGRCEIWAPLQGVELAQQVAVQVTGLPSDRIVIHRTLLGGGFGRRLLADFVKEALLIAMAVKRPVKLIWSREQDMTHDAYRPGMLHAISGALGRSGEAVALSHRVVSPSHMLYIFPRGMFPNVKDWTIPVAPPEKLDTMAVEGLLEIPYDIANQSVNQHRLELDVPVSVWRTTGHGANNFVLECFVDELAELANTDPIAFRRSLLRRNDRALKLLDVVLKESGWGSGLSAERAQGVALAAAFGGLIANVAEVSVADGKVKVHRVVSAVDCGRTLDPESAESNILGGIVWGLSAMRTEMTFEKGGATKNNFDGFDPLHLWETPRCDVHFIDSGEKLGGTGELGPVPVIAAVCNAIFAATGRRIRALPLSASGLSFA